MLQPEDTATSRDGGESDDGKDGIWNQTNRRMKNAA
jgi:hypothetical protein